MLLLFAGVKNRGVLNGLLRLIYEDMGTFDNSAVSVVRVSFAVEIREPDALLGSPR